MDADVNVLCNELRTTGRQEIFMIRRHLGRALIKLQLAFQWFWMGPPGSLAPIAHLALPGPLAHLASLPPPGPLAHLALLGGPLTYMRPHRAS